MPDAADYAKYPEHPLYGVPQEVLDAARVATEGAAACNDIANDLAHPLADAVVAEIIVAGFTITRSTT